MNGGTCTNRNGSFSCTCLSGYTGIICENTLKSCLSYPCNKGICTDTVTGFSCNCDGTGYEGSVCEVDIDECSRFLHFCCNSSTCVNTLGGYNCSCAPRFYGRYCNETEPTSTPTTPSKQTNHALEIGLSVVIVLLVATGVAVAWFILRSKTGKSEGKYNPIEMEMRLGSPYNILE